MGRVGNTDKLNLQAAGIGINERGFITVDKQLRTGQSHIWAIGDVKGGWMFTHVAGAGIEDAVYVCFIFSVLTRLADAFDFDLTTPARWQVGDKVFYWPGYSRTSIPG